MNPGTFTWTTWLPMLIAGAALAISILSFFWNVIAEKARNRARLEVWQRNHYTMGGDDEHTRIQLIFRNLSHRPTAIIDVYVRGEDGHILEGSGYKGRVKLPIQIDAWNVQQVEFLIEKNDEEAMEDIFIRDIDDYEIIINKHKEKKWVKKSVTK